jgi:hypothetical protein
MKWNKLIATIYAEQDFGRSIATTIAGVVGLATYLFSLDWVIAVFAAVIAFPVCRVVASGLYSRWKHRHAEIVRQIQREAMFQRFSPQERQILEFFVRAGGVCVSWGYVNKSKYPFPRPAINSLMVRGLASTSVMEDGMSESFVLDIDTFDMAQRVLGERTEAEPSSPPYSEGAGDCPF